MLELFISIVMSTLIYSTPIIIAALGGLFSERSGVVNIALEGLMMIGGFSAATALVFLERGVSTPVAVTLGIVFGILVGLVVYIMTKRQHNVKLEIAAPVSIASAVVTFFIVFLLLRTHGSDSPWIALVVGSLAGMLVSVLHAYLSINLSSDQVISGTAINIFAGGITIYLAGVFFNQQRTETFERGFTKEGIPFLSDIGGADGIGSLFKIFPTVYIAFILVIITWYVLYKTSFGLRLRATGEHPQAVDSMGINVFKMRYFGVLASGALAGLAGGIMVLTVDTQYSAISIHGTGFIALAALIFGKWRPAGLLGASLFFGFSQILSIYSSSIATQLNMEFIGELPNEFYDSLPYVLTIIALIIFSGRSVGPKAAGEPYDKGKR